MLKNAIQNAVDVCLESTGLRDLYYNYRLKCFVVSHPDMGEMVVDELSDGFRSIISMVADLAYRMARLNPQLREDAVTKTPGLVLIDEVEMAFASAVAADGTAGFAENLPDGTVCSDYA